MQEVASHVQVQHHVTYQVRLAVLCDILSPTASPSTTRTQTYTQDGLLLQVNQLDAYVAWHRRLDQAPTLDELMSLPSTNERWAKDGKSGGLAGAPKVTVILNLFKREVRVAPRSNFRSWQGWVGWPCFGCWLLRIYGSCCSHHGGFVTSVEDDDKVCASVCLCLCPMTRLRNKLKPY